MLGIVDLPLFIGAVFLLNVTPGPDTAYIVGRSVAQGRAAGVMSSLGVSAGCCVHALATAFGLTAVLAASPVAFTAIKYAGGAYLAWLGLKLLWSSWRTSARGAGAAAQAPATDRRSLRALFMQGFLTNVLNPKVILFFVSFIPQFVDPRAGQQTLAFLALGAIMVAMSTVWTVAVAWMAGTLTRRAGEAPRLKCWLDRVIGMAFIGLGARLAMTQR
ncbi:LysE family translocator [Cupriavidus gilardii]|uniref:LysE family translocator n=1 Tax=Cupriavidus gilardii TaxID=82541 RepID=A0A6N1BMQ6_9BURK|nr:LysE family translocator [Cupriavidus gilardii]ALD92049.1 homoserine/homoserine lactone efflux protein [Cupriavidus gilardii CR3]KAB0593977.1 LysE family translocator [Cupriavidus gilardii]MCT9013927.1 LysE family translocator [Cupriavidus gilardii]MCT9052115.1 LysE family translocator [Cupriavidus gilardii]MCT9074568.1 LysE family translocator [Cupriavidus gilardii]